MKLLFLVIFLVTIYPSSIFAQVTDDLKPVDEEIVKEVDVTGDGRPEKIILHLIAKSIKTPFAWTLTVISEGKQIYSYNSDDKWLDEFFNDEGYVLGCKGYLSCKKKYYNHDLLDALVLTGNKWYNVDGILDKSQSNTLFPLGRKQLQECCDITGQLAEEILNKIENKFRAGKAIAINVLQSPVHANSPLIYVPEIGRFISFYEE